MRKTIEILIENPNLTTKEIAERLYNKSIAYGTKEYSSTSRTLRSLEKKRLVKSTPRELTWKACTEEIVKAFVKKAK